MGTWKLGAKSSSARSEGGGREGKASHALQNFQRIAMRDGLIRSYRGRPHASPPTHGGTFPSLPLGETRTSIEGQVAVSHPLPTVLKWTVTEKARLPWLGANCCLQQK